MTIDTIVLATDFEESTDAAFDYATSLAQRLGAKLVVVHAYEVTFIGEPYGVDTVPPDVATRVRAAAGEALENVAARARSSGVSRVETALREGTAWQEIDAVAQAEHANLIVVGTHGRGGVARALLGSVAQKVVRTAPCAVLTVRGPVGQA